MVVRVMRSNVPSLFFSKKEKERIVSAIRKAEQQTSAEIRVHLERRFRGYRMGHVRKVFEALGMHDTKEENGILILLDTKSRRFTIFGDQGIDAKVPEGFWREIAERMRAYFQSDQFAEGIIRAIQEIGEKLQAYFPYERDDKNELPDGISYSL